MCFCFLEFFVFGKLQITLLKFGGVCILNHKISKFEFYHLKFEMFEFYTLTFQNLDFTP